jgi:uncharacterized protein
LIVLDSSFLIAFHNRDDVHHESAAAAIDELLHGKWGEALLPEYVLLEVTTVLAARRNLTTAAQVGELLLEARELELVPCHEFLMETFDVFRRQKGRNVLSFTDSAIVAIARRKDAKFIATFDRGFDQIKELVKVP